jgi:hypothetical protein
VIHAQRTFASKTGVMRKTVNKNMGLSGEGRLCDAAPGEELQSHLLSTANQGVRKKSRQPKDARRQILDSRLIFLWSKFFKPLQARFESI